MKLKHRFKIHDDWETPKYILDYIKLKYFDNKDFFDPCPINYVVDGLTVEWQERNYINPPYNRKDKEAFIIKAFEESQKGKICVMLLPVSTSTRIFHNIILPYADIEFLRGRVKFIGINSKGKRVQDKSGQHDSMIIRFRTHTPPFISDGTQKSLLAGFSYIKNSDFPQETN
jgi:site-specific DNA-methyltransferase (adenine-specific)